MIFRTHMILIATVVILSNQRHIVFSTNSCSGLKNAVSTALYILFDYHSLKNTDSAHIMMLRRSKGSFIYYIRKKWRKFRTSSPLALWMFIMEFWGTPPPPGDILGNVRVGMSDSSKRNVPRKIFEILFSFETSKNGHSRRGKGRLQVSLSSSHCVFLLPKIFFYSHNCHFIFQDCPFIFQKCPFIFQKCPFVSWNCPFVFQKCLLFLKKCTIVFQNCPLDFQKCFIFVYCARLFPIILFTSRLTLLLVLLRAAQRDNICLVLVLFPL